MREGLTVPVLPEPGSHRLDRLALSVGEQTPQVDLPPPTLIVPRERLEHLRREHLQLTTQSSYLVRRHTHLTPHRPRRTRTAATNLTKPYWALSFGSARP
ncbi:hypothetical protein [Streptomyces sp. 8N706]|uniref:hypothetical protein n=1 Tax=Streptomyces sp. 8N706 TaxID=3457416 RepID=UPI003FD373C6